MSGEKKNNKKVFIIIGIIFFVLIISGVIYATLIQDNCEKNIDNNSNSFNSNINNSSSNNENNEHFGGGIEVKKPIIYVYPEEENIVSVKVGSPQNLTHAYPKYEGEWNVIAKPNGDLIDIKTGRNLYSLYWEGINTVESNMSEGFIVEGTDIIEFLEEKLEILGLSEREANEFIIYWLPNLESNKYNFIRFQTSEEIENNMSLDITPKPDSIIRIVMEFKGLDNKIEVSEQTLETPTRNGFVVVEWGGTEII